jgi:hypothetical protein
MTTTFEPTAVQLTEYERDPIWGGASHPARTEIEPGSAPWKDHIYLAFWDVKNEAYGFLHWNSSPNHETTKAQVNISLKGTVIDFVEPLPLNELSFTSESADFDLKNTIEYTHERLTGTLTVRPQYGIVDFAPSGTLPTLGDNEPLQHFEHGLTITGTLLLDGVPHEINAVGFRTRTWGFRDDSLQFAEYYFLWATFEDHAVGFIKQLHPSGEQITGGGFVSEGRMTPVHDIHIVKNRAGFAHRITVDLADGTSFVLSSGDQIWGGWCPIGLPEREGPAFSAYDDIRPWTDENGDVGHGLSEYGQIRVIH